MVDDNPINLKVIVEALYRAGYKVSVADNGQSALKRAVHNKPDIILLDVMMPQMDGFETCRRLKALPETQDIPVIFMTILTEINNKVMGFQVGAVDYLTKPLHHDEVLARLETHLHLYHLTRHLETQHTRLSLVNQVGQRITSRLPLDRLLTEILALIHQEFNYYFIGLWLGTKAGYLSLKVACGNQLPPHWPSEKYVISLDKPAIINWAYHHKKPYLVNDITPDIHYLTLTQLPPTCTQLVLPLQYGQEMIGVMDIHTSQSTPINQTDQLLLQTLATQIAIAIYNAQLVE